jgi:CBS domain-containing protein
MRCEELMKRDVACLKAQEPVQAAAERMRAENIGFLPVCDDDGRVLGTLTDRDIAIRVCAENRPAAQTPVGEVMTREVIACAPSDELRVAEEAMARYRKSRILVINERGQLVGVISLSDLAEEEPAKQVSKALRQISSRENKA